MITVVFWYLRVWCVAVRGMMVLRPPKGFGSEFAAMIAMEAAECSMIGHRVSSGGVLS